MIKEKLFIVPIDSNRVELWVRSYDEAYSEEDKILIAELHPKHAEDLLKVYNRTDEQYDNLYPSA